jgi:hypothetical protein
MAVTTLRDAIKAAIDSGIGAVTGQPDTDRLAIAFAFADALDPYFIHAAGDNAKATATVSGVVKTDVTTADPEVYLKETVDTLLAAKAALNGSNATGTWPISITGNAATLSNLTVQASRDATDWNTRLSPGFYNADASPANSVGVYAHLIVAMSNDTGLQIAGGYNNDQLWFRGWYSSGAGFTPWRTILHSGNYTSYSPGLTGGGASGTWPISISGNAATASGLSGITINQNLGTANSPTFANLTVDGTTLGTLYGTFFSYDYTSAPYANISGHALGHGFGVATAGSPNFYAGTSGAWVSGAFYAATSLNSVDAYLTSGWYRTTGEYGLYSTSYGTHLYPSSNATYWNITSTTSSGAFVMRTGFNGTINGYLYFDSSGFGLLHSAGGWAVRVAPGGGSGTLTGTWTTSGDHYANNYYTSSSRTLKHAIKRYTESALGTIRRLNIVSYFYNRDPKTPRVGFIAEDTPTLLSGLDQKHFDHGNAIGLLLKAVQELADGLDTLALAAA